MPTRPTATPNFTHALQLSHSGSLIIVDNVVREGRVLDADSDDADIRGIRRLVAMLAGNARTEAAALQTVGDKGHDDWIIARVKKGSSKMTQDTVLSRRSAHRCVGA